MPLPWPYNINKPAEAVHWVLDPDCPYQYPQSCPEFKQVVKILDAYNTWKDYRD